MQHNKIQVDRQFKTHTDNPYTVQQRNIVMLQYVPDISQYNFSK